MPLSNEENATHIFHLLHLVEQVGSFSLERSELVRVRMVRGECSACGPVSKSNEYAESASRALSAREDQNL